MWPHPVGLAQLMERPGRGARLMGWRGGCGSSRPAESKGQREASELLLLVTEERRQLQQVQGDERRERLPAMWDLGATLEMAGLPVTRTRRGVDPGRGGQALCAGERLGARSWGSGSREADPMELVPRRVAACCWPGGDDEALIRRGSSRQRR